MNNVWQLTLRPVANPDVDNLLNMNEIA